MALKELYIFVGTCTNEDATISPLWGHCHNKNRYNQKLIYSQQMALSLEI
jgi:hypothetical protein